MKQSKLFVGTIILFAMLTLYACAPGPHGNSSPNGMRLSGDEVFTSADANNDGVLSKEEFKDSLPQ